MKRMLKIAIVLAMLGMLINFGIAWACSLLSSPPAPGTGLGILGQDPLLLARLRREFFERDGPDPGGRDRGTLFVAVAYQSFGAVFMDVAVRDEDIPMDEFRGPLLRLGVVRAGWPMHALEGEWQHDASRSPTPQPPRARWAIAIPDHFVRADRLFIPRMLVFRPLWFGFVVNSLLYAAVLLAPWIIRVLLRVGRHQCTACGYPIGQSPICTECGRKLRRQRKLMPGGAAKLSP